MSQGRFRFAGDCNLKLHYSDLSSFDLSSLSLIKTCIGQLGKLSSSDNNLQIKSESMFWILSGSHFDRIFPLVLWLVTWFALNHKANRSGYQKKNPNTCHICIYFELIVVAVGDFYCCIVIL